MQWRGRAGSGNVDDRRGKGGGLAVGGGIGGIILVVIYLVLGGDPQNATQMMQQGQSQTSSLSPAEQEAQDSLAAFTKVVLKDTEDIWDKILPGYKHPQLVLFTGSVQSGCGGASAAVGPFYCPADQKVYIDLSFFKELKDRFGAAGDFAMAYVIAHEVGHHVQNLLGTSGKVQQQSASIGKAEGNRLSVKLELQADFYAGVWAYYQQNLKNVLDPGDIEEALTAANAIGDDKLQREAQGQVVPDAFTHGTSAQRMYWFKKGFETGDLKQGNTFEDRSLR